jgi:hypothetical protein
MGSICFGSVYQLEGERKRAKLFKKRKNAVKEFKNAVKLSYNHHGYNEFMGITNKNVPGLSSD